LGHFAEIIPIFGPHHDLLMEEEFEDTKVLIRIRKSKNRQHNGRKKKYKKTKNDLQNIHIKLMIEETRTPLKHFKAF
jgi:hypothetical protein